MKTVDLGYFTGFIPRIPRKAGMGARVVVYRFDMVADLPDRVALRRPISGAAGG